MNPYDNPTDAAFAVFHAQYGVPENVEQGRIVVLGTGLPELDQALGGGIVRSGVVEIHGPPSSGKTTLSLRLIARAQEAGLLAAFVDAEKQFDPKYARALRINPDNLLVSKSSCGEEALESVEIMIRSGVGFIVVDSAAALTPYAVLEARMEDVHPGLFDRLMAQGLRKISAAVLRFGATIVFTNQVRVRLARFASDEKTVGGPALGAYADQRIELDLGGSLHRQGMRVGSKSTATVVKNIVAPPQKTAMVPIIYKEFLEA